MIYLQAFNPDPATSPRMGVRVQFRDTRKWLGVDLASIVDAPPAKAIPMEADPSHANGRTYLLDLPSHPSIWGGYRHVIVFLYHLDSEDVPVKDGVVERVYLDYQVMEVVDGGGLACFRGPRLLG